MGLFRYFYNRLYGSPYLQRRNYLSHKYVLKLSRQIAPTLPIGTTLDLTKRRPLKKRFLTWIIADIVFVVSFGSFAWRYLKWKTEFLVEASSREAERERWLAVGGPRPEWLIPPPWPTTAPPSEIPQVPTEPLFTWWPWKYPLFWGPSGMLKPITNTFNRNEYLSKDATNVIDNEALGISAEMLGKMIDFRRMADQVRRQNKNREYTQEELDELEPPDWDDDDDD